MSGYINAEYEEARSLSRESLMTKLFAAAVLCAVAVATAAPAFAAPKKCKNCVAPRPHYDSEEVVRTTRDIDKSRVINTQSVIEVPSRKVRTYNHLVIRQNTIRHVGVVRHNHTIIEKEIRYKRRAPVARVYAQPVVINFVTQPYITVRRPAMVSVPYVYPRCRSCHRVLRVRG
jgi:hypothetical protein